MHLILVSSNEWPLVPLLFLSSTNKSWSPIIDFPCSTSLKPLSNPFCFFFPPMTISLNTLIFLSSSFHPAGTEAGDRDVLEHSDNDVMIRTHSDYCFIAPRINILTDLLTYYTVTTVDRRRSSRVSTMYASAMFSATCYISSSCAYATSMTSVCLSVRLSVMLVGCAHTQCNKNWKLAHDRKGRCIGFLHAIADPERSIL